MAKFALLVELMAKPGKEAEVEAFLEKEASLVRKEPGTLSWHAGKVEGETGVYRIFDTFDDEAAREAHLERRSRTGAGGEGRGVVLPSSKVHRLQVFAQK